MVQLCKTLQTCQTTRLECTEPEGIAQRRFHKDGPRARCRWQSQPCSLLFVLPLGLCDPTEPAQGRQHMHTGQLLLPKEGTSRSLMITDAAGQLHEVACTREKVRFNTMHPTPHMPASIANFSVSILIACIAMSSLSTGFQELQSKALAISWVYFTSDHYKALLVTRSTSKPYVVRGYLQLKLQQNKPQVF